MQSERFLLLRVQLDDECLLDLEINILTSRLSYNRTCKCLFVEGQPSRYRTGIGKSLKLRGLSGCFLNGDRIACLQCHRRDVCLLAIYEEMTVCNELTSFVSGRSKTKTIHDIVETEF